MIKQPPECVYLFDAPQADGREFCDARAWFCNRCWMPWCEEHAAAHVDKECIEMEEMAEFQVHTKLGRYSTKGHLFALLACGPMSESALAHGHYGAATLSREANVRTHLAKLRARGLVDRCAARTWYRTDVPAALAQPPPEGEGKR